MSTKVHRPFNNCPSLISAFASIRILKTLPKELTSAGSCLATVKNLVSVEDQLENHPIILLRLSCPLFALAKNHSRFCWPKDKEDPLFHQVRQKKNFWPRWISEIAVAYGGKPITPVLTSHATVGRLQGLDFHLKSPFWDSIAAYFGDARPNLRCYLAKSHYLFHFLLQPINLKCWVGEMYGPNFTAKRGENPRNNSQIICPTLNPCNARSVA